MTFIPSPFLRAIYSSKFIEQILHAFINSLSIEGYGLTKIRKFDKKKKLLFLYSVLHNFGTALGPSDKILDEILTRNLPFRSTYILLRVSQEVRKLKRCFKFFGDDAIIFK